MDINYDKNTVIIFGKSVKMDVLINKYSQLSGEQVYHFFTNRGIFLPRRINCLAMVSVLNNRIKMLHSNSLNKDHFVRLQYYRGFTEVQLFNLFNKICGPEEFKQYRINLFRLIILNFVGLNLNDGELNYLRNLKKTKMESFEDYFTFVSSGCLEQDHTFDGQDIDVLNEYIGYTASAQEIYELAEKYGINLPQRLKKQEMLDFVIYYLKAKNLYKESIEEELNGMSLAALEEYAKNNDINMQANMNKQQLITYLFYILDQCEIQTTSVKRLEIPEEYIPLEFGVDLDVVNIFQNGDIQKVIYYEGHEADEDAFWASVEAERVAELTKLALQNEVAAGVRSPEELNQASNDEPTPEQLQAEQEMAEQLDNADQTIDTIQEKVIDEAPIQEETVEEIVEEVQEEITEEVVEEVQEELTEEVVEETQEEPTEEVVEEEATDEVSEEDENVIDELIQENAIEEIVEEPEEVFFEDDGMDLRDVRKNEQYGSNIFEKQSKGPGKIIALSACALVALAIIIYCAVVLLK